VVVTTRGNLIVRTEGLTKVFRGKTGDDVLAVDGVDLAIAHGETFGLVGPDGAGKTTTTRLLAGLMRPTRGRAEVLGHDTLRQVHSIKSQIGYMAQRFSLYGDLTVMENLRFFARVHGVGRKEQAERIPRLLQFAGLERFADHLSQQLSGGMKKKLALATILVHEPSVVLLDEPTLGVDPVSRREFWDLLAILRAERGLTIFICTPYMDEAERCHRVGLIYNGRLVAQGVPKDIERQVPGELLDFRPSDFAQAKMLAPSLPGVLQVQTLGDRLRLFVDDATVRGPQITAALSEQGITIQGLRAIQPRMEEAFISLIRQYDEQSAGFGHDAHGARRRVDEGKH
jgi:ABC-2 type transport system ATP-binding protein